MGEFDDQYYPQPRPPGGDVYCDDAWPGYPTRQDAIDNESPGMHCVDPDGEFSTPNDPLLIPAEVDGGVPGSVPDELAPMSGEQVETWEEEKKRAEALEGCEELEYSSENAAEICRRTYGGGAPGGELGHPAEEEAFNPQIEFE